MRRLWLVFVLLLLPVVAFAELLDYEAESADWTGLSQFVAIAQVTGARVETATELDYSALDPSQPLVIVYPREPLDVRQLAQYVSDGGRILLADDFGESESLLERLEIQRIVTSPGNLPHTNFANGNRALPVITSRGSHPLLTGVNRVVANHPAVINNAGGPVLRYDEGGGFVYDMNLGDGKVIVVADASIFINGMINVAENDVFTANVLRYICRDEPGCRPLLVTKDFAQHGTYDRSLFSLNDTELLEAFNDFIQEVQERLPGADFLYWMSLLLCAGVVVYVVTVFPARRTRAYSRHVTKLLESVPPPQSEFDWNVSRFADGGRSMNYALPIAILKESFEELFLDALGHWPSSAETRPGIRQLGAQFATTYLADRTEDVRSSIEDDVVALLATFAHIPPRARVFLDNDAHYSEGTLLQYHRRAMTVLTIMGLTDEYERRTRGII